MTGYIYNTGNQGRASEPLNKALDELKNPPKSWLHTVATRMEAACDGSFGVHRERVRGSSVCELKFSNSGPGEKFRLYYCMHGDDVIFLSCGFSGNAQAQTRDITQAAGYATDAIERLSQWKIECEKSRMSAHSVKQGDSVGVPAPPFKTTNPIATHKKIGIESGIG